MIYIHTLFNQTLKGIILNLKHVQYTCYKIMPYCRMYDTGLKHVTSARCSHVPQRLSVTICDLLCWVRSLYVQLSLHNISPVYEVEVYEVSCDSRLKNEFSRKNLITFWLGVNQNMQFCQNLQWQLFCHLLPPICTNLNF